MNYNGALRRSDNGRPSMPDSQGKEPVQETVARSPSLLLSSSSDLSVVERCTVVVVGLCDSPQLLHQTQQIIRELQHHCGPIRGAHRFAVHPPSCLTRSSYSSVALAVTFATIQAALVAASFSSRNGNRNCFSNASWLSAYEFSVRPIMDFHLSPEEAEDCRKTFAPTSIMLAALRKSNTTTENGISVWSSMLPARHQACKVLSQPSSSSTEAKTEALAETGMNGLVSPCTVVEKQLLMKYSNRWGIRHKLWFALCSDLSWYTRVMDWGVAEAAAARGDAVIIDEACLCSVFYPLESIALGLNPVKDSQDRSLSRSNLNDQCDALVAMQKTYGIKPATNDKKEMKWKRWFPWWFQDKADERRFQLSSEAQVGSTSHKTSRSQYFTPREGLVRKALNCFFPGWCFSTLSLTHSSLRTAYDEQARKRLKSEPFLTPFASSPATEEVKQLDRALKASCLNGRESSISAYESSETKLPDCSLATRFAAYQEAKENLLHSSTSSVIPLNPKVTK